MKHIFIMDIIYILIPLVLLVLVVAIYFFFWAVNSDQFDDFDGPAYHIIIDDKRRDSNNV